MVLRVLILIIFFIFIGVNAFSKNFVIENMKVEPFPFDANSGVTVEPVLNDNSLDFVFEYRWFVNDNENFFEKGPVFPGALLKRGDQLSIEVTPVTLNGERLQPFVSLPLEAVNASPLIVSEPPPTLTDQGFSYLVQATDPDADPLTFQLAESPAGMVIDSDSGQITWAFDTMPQGVFPVHIVVEDGYGGLAEQTFELNLSLVEKEATQ